MKPIETDVYTTELKKIVAALDKHKTNIIEALRYANGTHTYDDVVIKVISREVLFWEEGDSFVITEFTQHPQCLSLHVFLAGGNLSDLMAIHKKIAPWARDLGCVAITIAGRSGWERALKKMGWEYTHTCLALDIREKLEFEEWAEEKVEPKPRKPRRSSRRSLNGQQSKTSPSQTRLPH